MDSLPLAFFFELGNNRSFCDTQIPADIPHPTAVQSLFFYLLFDAGTTGIIRIVELEAFFTVFA
jgi:hypothetical protein